MKVAVIGAGIAGLSCAHELERLGVKPVVYERNCFIGEQHPHVSASLEIIYRPVKDSLKYFNDRMHINIKPLNTCNTIIHNSPNKSVAIKGDFGYFFERDRGGLDFKNQVYSDLKKTEFRFSEIGDYETLSKKYDYVVIANGTTNFTSELGCWKEWLNTYVRGAVVLGDFDPNTLIVWIHKDYCKNGYAYLTPFDSKRASLALVVTDIAEREVNAYWDAFIYNENIKYDIQQEFTLNHKSGVVYPHNVGNIYLAGDAGGVIDPFLGFGQMSSVTMGVMAARSIVQKKDYEKLLKDILVKNLQLHQFRKAFDLSGNTGYDMLMTAIGLPGIKHLMYFTPFNVIKYGSFFMGLISRMNERKVKK